MIIKIHIKNSTYSLIVACLLPINSIINPITNSIFDIKTILAKRSKLNHEKRLHS